MGYAGAAGTVAALRFVGHALLRGPVPSANVTPQTQEDRLRALTTFYQNFWSLTTWLCFSSSIWAGAGIDTDSFDLHREFVFNLSDTL